MVSAVASPTEWVVAGPFLVASKQDALQLRTALSRREASRDNGLRHGARPVANELHERHPIFTAYVHKVHRLDPSKVPAVTGWIGALTTAVEVAAEVGRKEGAIKRNIGVLDCASANLSQAEDLLGQVLDKRLDEGVATE